ncbi:MAG: hypothetical protein JXD23_12965 [Spirochaetales bacterium]|nr:hypothetical protein [Spirochaetales bacterium]
MAGKRILYPVLAGWEIVRLLACVGLLAFAFSGSLFPRGEIMAFALLLGSGNLLVPFGALYLFFTGVSSRPLRLTMVAAKALGLFSSILGFAVVFFHFVASAAAEFSTPSSKPFFEASILFFIFFIDLIFLSLLISLKEEADPSPPSRP